MTQVDITQHGEAVDLEAVDLEAVDLGIRRVS
jgi:hypothetical protein